MVNLWVILQILQPISTPSEIDLPGIEMDGCSFFIIFLQLCSCVGTRLKGRATVLWPAPPQCPLAGKKKKKTCGPCNALASQACCVGGASTKGSGIARLGSTFFCLGEKWHDLLRVWQPIKNPESFDAGKRPQLGTALAQANCSRSLGTAPLSLLGLLTVSFYYNNKNNNQKKKHGKLTTMTPVTSVRSHLRRCDVTAQPLHQAAQPWRRLGGLLTMSRKMWKDYLFKDTLMSYKIYLVDELQTGPVIWTPEPELQQLAQGPSSISDGNEGCKTHIVKGKEEQESFQNTVKDVTNRSKALKTRSTAWSRIKI